MNLQVRHVSFQRFRYVARIAANVDVANDLFENSRLLAHAHWLTGQAQWNRCFDLFALDQPFEVRVNQTTAHWIDLPVVEHDLAGSNAFHIQGENGVPARVGSQNCSQLTKGREGRYALALTAIDDNRNLSFATCAARIVLPTSFAR